MTTAEIMDAMKYDGALVTIERLQVRAARLERERVGFLHLLKEAADAIDGCKASGIQIAIAIRALLARAK